MRHEQYNRLSDVVPAYDMLGPDLSATIAPVSTLILDAGYEDVIGMRLLHRHCMLEPDEIMVETAMQVDEGALEVVTAPVIGTPTGFSAHANCWMAADGELHPVEFSIDDEVRVASELLLRDVPFARAFVRKVESLGLSHVLGPCALKRSCYPVAGFRLDQRLVETTDITGRANVVRLYSSGELPAGRLIETTWKATRKTAFNECRNYCEAGSCVPFSACVVNSEGDHSQEETHSPGEHSSLHYETGE